VSEALRKRHVLVGIRPEPLASYLAGLGLIRLIGEQADPSAAFQWEAGVLVVEAAVEDIAHWLVGSYVPTPVLSPWNNGSGFGVKDVEPKKTLAALKQHPSPRLAPFQATVRSAAHVAASREAHSWEKSRTVQEFRNSCPDEALPWIDAAVVLADDETYFPPLLGTGGNDGRLDFSTNFHQRLLEVLGTTEKARSRSLTLARDLLGGQEAEQLANAAVGQFDPAAAGGPGSSRFGAAASLVNPWAFVLLIEGALLFAASASRRYQHGAGRAAMPFTVYASPDGSASGADGEETRGEIWAPVWARPYTLAEVRQLFGEARASWNGHPARRSIDFYAATRTLGVARGVDEFVRYGLQRRNGLAFTAVPIDRVDVLAKPGVRLLGQVQDWANRAGSSDPSAAVHQAHRQFDKAQLAYARNGDCSDLRDLLAALTTLEQAVGHSGRAREKVPVRRVPRAAGFLAEFLQAPASAELRIAVGLASCATRSATGSGRTMRQLLLPIDPPAQADRARSSGRWRDAPVVAGFGSRSLPRVLADVLSWRLRTGSDESSRVTFRGVPTFQLGIRVPAADLHAWVLGMLDESAIAKWLRACLALDWYGVSDAWPASDPPLVVPTLGLLHPFGHGLGHRGDSDAPKLALQSDWANRLVAGQAGPVHAEAVARLRLAGYLAVPEPPRPADGTLIAAALVAPVLGWHRVMRRLTRPLRQEVEQTRTSDPLDAELAAFPDELASSSQSPNLAEELS
jgi:CRISPR-associated protein Csx17